MRKFFLLALCVIFCMSFVGCLGEDGPKKDTVTTESTEEKNENVFGLNESAVFNTLKFTALEIKESSGTTFYSPESGNIFVGVKFEVENVSNEEQTISTLMMFEGYADNVKCEYSFTATCAFSEGTLDGTIAPGKKLIGWYALEVPQNWQELELDVKANWLSNNVANFIFEK